MLNNRQARLVLFLRRRPEGRPLPDVLSKASRLGIREDAVDDLADHGILDLLHDEAGAPYLAVSETGRSALDDFLCSRISLVISIAALILSVIALCTGR